MKIRLLFFAFLICCHLPEATSQPTKGIGIMAGVNLSHIYITDAGGFNDFNQSLRWQPGVQAGLTAIPVLFSEQFGLKLGFGYFQRGAASDSKGPTLLDKDGVFRFHYLSLPITVLYYPTERLFFELGPQLSYLVGAKTHLKESGEITSFNRTIDHYENIGLSAGLGYDIQQRVKVSLQFYQGFLSIDELEKRDSSEKSHLLNQSILLGLEIELWRW
ncbi:MAG: PorT family protein [Lewinellaceae bacterium]|nr:PorT family protein [Phaeodactylibacter sp.]MCB9037216.1 PorT family protein [Lewinellaceae bacterium]